MLSCGNWETIDINTTLPFSGRWGHSVCLHESTAFIFGGFDGGYSNDLYSLSLTTMTVESLHSSLNLPAKRSHHTAVVYQDSIIIYGGTLSQIVAPNSNEDAIQEMRDLYEPFEYNILSKIWNRINTINCPQVFRTFHTANVLHQDYMFVYGGETYGNDGYNIFPTAVFLNLKTKKWGTVQIEASQSGGSRCFHCSVVINNVVYIYGGYSSNYECINDMLILDFNHTNFSDENVTVQQIKHINFSQMNDMYPFPRWGASANQWHKKIILFGGRNKFDFNDLWQFDVTNEKWSKIVSLNESPSSRRRHISFIFKNLLFISGGFNGDFISDLKVKNLFNMAEYRTLNDEFCNFINHEKFSDFVLVNKFTRFYCHRYLFFSRIPYEDVVISPFLQEIHKCQKKKTVIDISEYSAKNETILKLIELMYLGYFRGYLRGSELTAMFTLLKQFNMQKTRQIVFKKIAPNVMIDMPPGIQADMIETIIHRLPQQQLIYINCGTLNVLLKPNALQKVKCVYSNLIFHQFTTPAMKRVKMNMKIIDIINRFIMNDTLPIITTNLNDLCLFVQLLFYADFFCFSSLYNKVESAFIVVMNGNHQLTFEFNIMILILSYFSNSTILFNFLLEKIMIEYSCNEKLIENIIKNTLIDEMDSNEIISEIEKIVNENSAYYQILNKEYISDFSILSLRVGLDNKKVQRKFMKNLVKTISKNELNIRLPYFAQ